MYMYEHLYLSTADNRLTIDQCTMTQDSIECYTVSQQNCAKLFLSELCQISTKLDNFWQKDGKEADIMRDALIFHLAYFTLSHYRVKTQMFDIATQR